MTLECNTNLQNFHIRTETGHRLTPQIRILPYGIFTTYEQQQFMPTTHSADMIKDVYHRSFLLGFVAA